MANIPQYISKSKPTTETVPKQTEVIGAGESIQKSGELLAILGEKMRKIGNANAESNAAIERKTWELEDSAKRAKEPDVNKSLADIDNEVRKSREEIAKRNFSDPIGKQEWLRKQELIDAGYIISQRAEGCRRKVKERRIEVSRDLELETLNPDIENAIQNAEKIVNDPANEDVYSSEERKQLLYEFTKDINKLTEERKETAEKLEIKNKTIEKDLKEQQYNQSYRSAMLDAFDGKLTIEAIHSLYKGDFINDVQRGKLENYIYYNLPTTDENDLTSYNKILQMQTEGKDTPEEINNTILENAIKNKITNNTAKQLISKTYTDYKNRKDELISLNAKEMRAVATEFFRDDIDEPDEEKVESTVYSFYRRVQEENADGDRISQIAEEIMTDTIRKEYPEINNINTINKVKEMFGIPDSKQEELPPPKSETQEPSPYTEYPDAFKENGVWKVIRKGQKYRVEE